MIDDSNIAYSIISAAAISDDRSYSGFDASDVSLTNQDDDTAGITVSPTSGLVTSESGSSTNFTVVLNTKPSADVIVNLSSSDATEGSLSTTVLTFTSGNWNVAQTVTVTGVDDAVNDGNI